VTVGDVGVAKDAQQIQNNIVRVDGQPSVYLPVLKQGGDTNTISVVEGVRSAVKDLLDVPSELVANVVFDQSQFVKGAIGTLLAVLLSVPLSALAAMIALAIGGSSINSMILAGLALAFTRLIFNSLVVLENIIRRLDLGDPPEVAAEQGGSEVADHRRRVLSRHVPLRREQVPLHGTRGRRRSGASCVVCGGIHRGSALLRAISESPQTGRQTLADQPARPQAAGSLRRINRKLRPGRGARRPAPRRCTGRYRHLLRAESAAVPAAADCVLPQNRRRAVRG
jgi:hypothetical protein